MSGSYFVPLGDGRFQATEATVGPWDPRYQHGGPPAALLGGALERLAPRPGAVLARITVELLGAIPIAEVEVEAFVERPGRQVELLAAELRADGRPAVRARAWRVREADAPPTPGTAPPPLPEDEQPKPHGWEFGYADSIEWRWASGGWLQPGSAAVWTRLRTAVVEGEEPTPLQRVLAVADSASGVAAVLDWRTHTFINTELTLHVLRPPRGEWVCLQAQTEIGAAGVAHSVLSDWEGPVARGAQALLVTRR